MRIDSIEYVVKYTPSSDKWSCKNRKNHIMGIMLSGSTMHYFENQKFELSENCIYFLNQKDNYSAEVSSYGSAYSVHFTTYEEIETDSFCVKVNDNKEIIKILDKMQISSSQGKKNLSMSYIYKLVATFEEIMAKSYVKNDVRMTEAKEYIDLHFKENNCLDDVAKMTGVSRRRFNDLFKNQFDVTPNRYLVGKKIELAKRFLTSGDFTLTEVADLCAFSDVYYFCKAFKKETGISPGKYMR